MKLLFFIMSLVLFSAHAIEEDMNYTDNMKNMILPFYQTHGARIDFKGEEGVSLSAIKFIHPQALGSIVLVQGWSETHAKYLEVIYDLYQAGYSVYTYDHRGQGFSKHLVASNNQISHVEYFDYYLKDFKTFMDTIVLKDVKDRPYLLSHSMGGAISLFHLKEFQKDFKAVVLCSPMLQINTKPYPEAVAYALVKGLNFLGKGKNYAPGKGDYEPTMSFEENIVTGSKLRFEMAQFITNTYPATILGGPSVNWVYESIKATKALKGIGKDIKLPLMVFKATDDQIVKIERMSTLCEDASNCRLEVFEGAAHEVLMETDLYRDRAFSEVLEFFKTHP